VSSIKSAFLATLAVCLWCPVVASQGTMLNVPQEDQQENFWCWAASSQAVLTYTGNAPGQCGIVDWAREQNEWGDGDCCLNGGSEACNRGNWFFGTAGAVDRVLENWGADSTRYRRAMSEREATEALDDNKPIFVGWRWTNGGGHAVVLHGYNGSTMTIMDPWDGPTTMSYSDLRSTSARRWSQSLRVDPFKVTFVVDDTGSMWDEIDSVKTTLIGKIDEFRIEGRFVKYTLITYKDDVTYVGSTIDHDEIAAWVSALVAAGGDDCPEEGYGALDEAAARAPRSHIWWMTDADSHGGWVRMLLTRAKLLLAGCTLHSTILGSCDSDASQANSLNGYVERSDRLENVNAYVAGETLSLGTGGLFFAASSETIDQSVSIILEEITSDATFMRSNLTEGAHSSTAEVDSSSERLNITLNVRAGATGIITVQDPFGTPLDPDMDGVSEIVAGNTRMLIIEPPAIVSGGYGVSTSSSMSYFVSASGTTAQTLSNAGDFTGGFATPIKVRLVLPTLAPATGLVGPGEEGPGGSMPPQDPPDPVYPFDPEALQFFAEDEDGANRRPIDLFDDGLHGDDLPGDGVFGGEVVFGAEGRYRLGVTEPSGFFVRVAAVLIDVTSVSVHAPASVVGAPGTTVTHQFTVENLSGADRTFDIGATSSGGWADLSGLPPTLTIDAGATTPVEIPVDIPPDAFRGDSSVLTLTVVAQDDPQVTDWASVQTSAWIGPQLQSLEPDVVSPGDTLSLIGEDFGDDPGAGNRSTDQHNVTISGLRVPDELVQTWGPTQIDVTVPDAAASGLVFLVSGGVESNSLLLTILVPTVTPTPTLTPTPTQTVVPTPNPVPAVGRWGQLLFVTVLAALGYLVLRPRR